MRTAVVGAGGIGGFIAGMLARSGADTALVARGAHLEAIRSHGLSVRSEAGDFTLKIPASSDLRELGEFDAVLLVVKAHQLLDLLPQLQPSIKAGATIVPMQNGLPFWYFAERWLATVDPDGQLHKAIPRDQIVGSVIHASGSIPAPGTIEQSGGMNYILGDPDEQPSSRADEIAAQLTAAKLNAPVVTTIKRDVWRKLLGNASLNPVSALTRLTVGKMVGDPQTRALIARLMEETVRVAAATGVDVEISVEERINYASRLADVKTSMLQDVEAHRPLELDPIVGAVAELANEFAVRAPTINTVYVLTKALSSGFATL